MYPARRRAIDQPVCRLQVCTVLHGSTRFYTYSTTSTYNERVHCAFRCMRTLASKSYDCVIFLTFDIRQLQQSLWFGWSAREFISCLFIWTELIYAPLVAFICVKVVKAPQFFARQIFFDIQWLECKFKFWQRN